MVIGGVLLFLSLKNVSLSAVKEELDNITYTWIVYSLCFYWVELSLRIVRWRVLLSHLKPPIAGQHFSLAFLSGYAANNVLPAKLGEAFRADFLCRLANVSRLTAFGSIILKRLFDSAEWPTAA